MAQRSDWSSKLWWSVPAATILVLLCLALFFGDALRQARDIWVRSGEKAFATTYPQGQGEIWLLNRPQFVTNGVLGRADNGILLCRLAEEVLRRRPGTLYFDEYFHGLRDRP